MRQLILGCLLATVVVACAPKTYTDPVARAQYTADQIVHRLGELQQTVIDLNHASKIRTDDARVIVAWISGDVNATPPVQGVVDVMRASPMTAVETLKTSWCVIRPRVQAVPSLAGYVADVDGFAGTTCP